ncbi:MAG: hypothetical protein A3H57_04580 [Candidatus Taylorbacteria bacterium RIFCSPLOWO2_02_FULL_43_11]|uniref:Uncharacterized protein n=1 Tax=Candidatus Taylorbacteria bacterium RIFCSPHIGHO2_02_FULL_43_32b TaxID=1802306 RepID=A0A1G2MFL2_9BACT|nr:MAG: hypothetical protein A2743_03435 [Candidatus Taylorbacteria bacterium RIFCSPHIGHO2_01_FULL_43_47]OHA21949.1 MAG: hypothetical protein A3C72_03590 [Candidatus Taylorbacteria bacterium RIFCSPHIGHO2_02_FULL_43_32b]OHA28747.1 MAG: hypothetical protein A3B08_03465 [Candidatus Taylorbacteria bacterium RIFCSPLOWO2_01_FULL_43_44]OHA35965.1 MAG: hypothetical protein A3H57_04580 [Candidatus Taylorbacteria bacterium RIFCSPLOWO2_02_FULL_43_11]
MNPSFTYGMGQAFGLILEDEVAEVLEKLLHRKEISSYERHAKNSAEDHTGRDFTVSKKMHDITVWVSFGVTMCARRAGGSRIRHRPIPVLWISDCTTESTQKEVGEMILSLFKRNGH